MPKINFNVRGLGLKRRRRYRDIKRLYGVTKTQYEAMIETQAGLCAICTAPMKPGKDTHIDHCHKTGRLRMMLCSACNKGIGLLKDNSAVTSAATHYLERYETDI